MDKSRPREETRMPEEQPNVLFLMTDQQRFDAIGALNDGPLYTPNLDRLVESGVTFENAYSQCPNHQRYYGKV